MYPIMQDHLNQAEQDKSKEKQKQRMLIAWKIIYILSRYTHKIADSMRFR